MKQRIATVRKNTMANRLFLPMVLLVCIYALVFLGTIQCGGVFRQLKDNEVERVHQSLLQKTVGIQEKLNLSGAKEETYERLLRLCREAEHNVESGVQADLTVTSEIAEEVEAIMENSEAAGAYVFFSSGSSYYVRKNESSERKAEFGEEALINERGILKSPVWSADTGGNMGLCPGYDKITEARSKTPGLEDTAYLCFDIVQKEEGNVPVFSVPLFDKEGSLYAVAGIEISSEAFKRFIPNNDIHGTYMLGFKDSEKNFIEQIVSCGDMYQQILAEENGVWLVDNNKDGIFEIGDEGERIVPNVLSEEIKLYEEGSAFSNESWVLCAIVEKSEFTASADRMKRAILTAVLVASGVGIMALYFFSRALTKPISVLVDRLNVINPRKSIELPKVNIYEVDRLSSAIQRVSKEVEMYALRVSEILRMAEIPVGVAEIDEITKEVYCTAKIFKLLGDIEPDEDYKVISIAEFKQMMEKFKRGTVVFELGEENDEMIFCDNNTYKVFSGKEDAEWVSLQTSEINGRLIVVVMDVTDKIKEKLKLEYERDFDELSRLLNKQAFAREAKKRLKTDTNPVGAMVMWDLDNLKYVNDTYGHEYGDIYIRESAKIFAYLEQHNGLVARRSGDEFFAFVSDDSEEELREIIYRIHHMLGEVTIKLPGDKKMKIRASAGIVWYPKDGSEYDDLIRKADFTMYDVKRSVKGSIREFDKQIYEQDEVLLSGKEELNEFLEKRLFKIAYQPIVDALTGEIYGYEALMRPQTDTLHSPGDVIRIARSQAKLLELEKILWEETLKDFFEHKNPDRNLHIFINSFPNVALSDSDIGDYSRYDKEQYKKIVVELIETDKSVDEYIDKKKECIEKTASMIALDDYGAGYNSESKLLHLSPEFVKIDREFISGVDKDEKKQELIINMISHVKKHDIMVIAEGVETEGELRFMQKNGADFIQGFYLAKPEFELLEDESAVKTKIKM